MSNHQQPQWHPLNPAPRPIQVARPNWFVRHQVLSTLIGLVLLVLIAVQAPNGSLVAADGAMAQAIAQSDRPGEVSAAPQPTRVAAVAPRRPAVPAANATVGARVRVGAFDVVVTQVQSDVTEVGNEFHSEHAVGAFTLVHLRVTNTDEVAQPLFDSNQKLVDTEGQMYAPSPRAQINLDGNDALLNELAPNETVRVILAYDLPKNARPASIDLRGSLVSQVSVGIALGPQRTSVQ